MQDLDNIFTRFEGNYIPYQPFSQSWAVAGFNRERAAEIMSIIEATSGKTVLRRIVGNSTLDTYFTDGTVLFRVPADDRRIGCKYGKLWCDKTIDPVILKCVILPCYRGEYDDIIWI